MDDVLKSRNDGGDLVANIQFIDRQPELEDLGQFDRVLFFVTGKVKGGINNIHRTEVLLNEENGYKDLHPSGRIAGVFEEAGYHPSLFRYSLSEDGIMFSKSTQLSTPGTYEVVFVLIGDDWAEIYVITIVVTVPLRVRTNNVDYMNGQTVTVNLTAPNYSPQYLYVFGSLSWTLEGVESAKISVAPLSGEGYDNTWDSTMITVSKPSALSVPELITTTFRIFAQSQWVDVVVNIHPPVTFNFVSPREGEAGVPGGTSPVYVYI